MNYFREKGYRIFDVTVFSCIEGIRKPEKGIYEITLIRLGVKPKEAIFIDDKRDNVNGAEKIGINTILFESPEQLKKELSSFSVKVR
jgi:epoxide hydrolase-like predicted phosphatase